MFVIPLKFGNFYLKTDYLFPIIMTVITTNVVVLADDDFEIRKYFRIIEFNVLVNVHIRHVFAFKKRHVHSFFYGLFNYYFFFMKTNFGKLIFYLLIKLNFISNQLNITTTTITLIIQSLNERY